MFQVSRLSNPAVTGPETAAVQGASRSRGLLRGHAEQKPSDKPTGQDNVLLQKGDHLGRGKE